MSLLCSLCLYIRIVGLNFIRYIQLMRRIQSTYWLEPAGSHGVWGLDDYHSLPFLFGASQLIDHPYLKPKSIHDSDLVDENALDYLYFQCIQHLRDTSSVSLRWHAPVLDDISAVKTWFKIEKGLHLLYFKEVLSKLPVMQHFLFGSLIPFSNPRLDQLSLLTTDPLHSMDAHVHVYAMGQEFPTCCGMRIPSIHAVLGAQTKAKANSTLKTLPFD
ncbi:Serine/threonine-protein phosphatase 2A activator 2 [Coelomomyces lativittatus]|nr:Serine/threonine-protein phosphatase 2A activator 2 [Coelomomyces lativittatus]